MPLEPASENARVLTREQIRVVASEAGFSGADLDIAVAVALAESGGDRMAHNAKPPDNSYGLWQINMLGSMGPDRRKRFGLSSNNDLFDPKVNARVAKGIHSEQGWQRGWTTYSSGKYKKYMVSGESSPDSGGDGNPAKPEYVDTTWSGKISSAINAAGQNVFKAGANIGGLTAAVAIGVIGVVILLRGSIGRAVPLGKMVKKL